MKKNYITPALWVITFEGEPILGDPSSVRMTGTDSGRVSTASESNFSELSNKKSTADQIWKE